MLALLLLDALAVERKPEFKRGEQDPGLLEGITGANLAAAKVHGGGVGGMGPHVIGGAAIGGSVGPSIGGKTYQIQRGNCCLLRSDL